MICPFIEISVQEGRLLMNAGEQSGTITPMDAADKFDADGKATLLFICDERQKVIKLQMEAMGFRFDGVKQ